MLNYERWLYKQLKCWLFKPISLDEVSKVKNKENLFEQIIFYAKSFSFLHPKLNENKKTF